jgi:hypothetical protein
MINPDPKMIAQLNLLSDLIGGSGDSSRYGLMKLSLFDDDDEDDSGPPLVLFFSISFYRFLVIRIQTRSEASSLSSNQRPRNEDITIDVSKVSLSID